MATVVRKFVHFHKVIDCCCVHLFQFFFDDTHALLPLLKLARCETRGCVFEPQTLTCSPKCLRMPRTTTPCQGTFHRPHETIPDIQKDFGYLQCSVRIQKKWKGLIHQTGTHAFYAVLEREECGSYKKVELFNMNISISNSYVWEFPSVRGLMCFAMEAQRITEGSVVVVMFL